MQIFETSTIVKPNDLDELNHVNNVRYVEWVQNIAKAHWVHSASKQILKDYYWVMLSHFIEYKSAALLNDSIKFKTYVVKSEGVTSVRMVEISNANNKLLAKSETTWCLMSVQTNRPTRITSEIIELFS